MKLCTLARSGMMGLLLVPGVGLAAQSPVHYGFSVHADFPESDLKTDLNGKVGGGASFQVSIEINDRMIVRPRIDIDVFPVAENDRPNSSYRDRVDLGSVGLGMDFLYSFSGRNDQGAYGLGGVGVQRWLLTSSSRDSDGNDFWQDNNTARNRTTPWVALGVGYQFNPTVGLEARAVGSKYNSIVEGISGTRTAVVTQLALTCRW